ncbi:MAG: phage integrase SAM-like domain-containing protein [Candidatus Cryptobacteroides sp.]
MLRIRIEGVSVIVVLDRRRMKNSGEYPVKIEVVYNRVQKYYPTGVSLTVPIWKRMSWTRQCPQKNLLIVRRFYRIANEVTSIVDKGDFSFSALDGRLGKRSSRTVNEMFQTMMDSLIDAGRVNSYYRCRSTLRSIVRFDGNEIPFSRVTTSWLRRFDRFLRDEGKSLTTISIYMKTLSTVLNAACRSGVIKESGCPFGRGRYVIPKGSARSLALTEEHIRMIIQYKGNGVRDKYRDLWLFSYLCNGINFKDMLLLKYRNVVDGEICFARAKTYGAYGGSKLIRAVITPEMREILRLRGNVPDGNPETFLFPFADSSMTPLDISNMVRRVIRLCNSALGKIAEELGIPKFSTYSARHTYATILLRKGVNLKYISESLGHSSLSVTEHYLNGADKKDRMKHAKLLTEYANCMKL